MNYGSDPADQIIRYSLDGTEHLLRLSGSVAKNFAVFVAAVLKDQKKTHGKTRLVRLLRENKPLKFFSVPKESMRDFHYEANRRGLLYVPIRDRLDPDNIEIAVWADDAAKVNRVIDRLALDRHWQNLCLFSGLCAAAQVQPRESRPHGGDFHQQCGVAKRYYPRVSAVSI